jgi:CheY-like chemotaxis protein
MKTNSGSTTILIVDDEPENLNVLEASLSSAGYRVALFPRGDLALAAAQEKQPALVLLDIRMPGLDGYEVCRRLKADERTRAIPVLFISALTASEDIAAGFACGGVDYIPKPFRETEVLLLLHQSPRM